MNFNLLLQNAVESLSDPRGVARWLLNLNLPRAARWQALLLVLVLSATAFVIISLITGDNRPFTVFGINVGQALGLGIVQFLVLVSGAFATVWVGRRAGGHGDLDGAILLIAWMQFVLLLLQMVQIIFVVFAPGTIGLMNVVALAVAFWLLTNFIAELHGFQSLAKVLMAIIATMFAMAFALALLMSLLGIAPVLEQGTINGL